MGRTGAPGSVSDLDDFAELHDAGDGGVVALVGDEVGGGVGEGVLHVGDGLEEEVADGVVRRRGSGREAAEAFVDLDADEAAGVEEAVGEFEVRAEVVVPVELRARRGGVHDTQSDHAVEDSTGFSRRTD